MATTVKINNKKYTINELEFRHYTKMEEQGFSVIEAFNKHQMSLVALAFTCAVTGLDREGAEELIQQHILGGGNIVEIAKKFSEAVAESDFFKKMLKPA